MNPNFSFIILTFNEEVHLPRLLASVQLLNAATYVLDSGSTDRTVEIALSYGANIKTNTFENHPKQWDFALKNFEINTPWTIGLDADQVVTPELLKLLVNFRPEEYLEVNGIYFNRKNIFQGKWIRYGGYYPMYLLKMFRTGCGYSDLTENMDHRFLVSGKTEVWKKGHIIEENLKENDIHFWFEKHERYSDLIALEEIERARGLRKQAINSNFFGDPNQRKAWFKKLWWKLPLGLRPFLYFSYRMIFLRGILEGRKGIYYHYLQGLWFRLLIDKKIKKLQKESYNIR
jgi:glycosyltransferase involved in cell wall biosynthesis